MNGSEIEVGLLRARACLIQEALHSKRQKWEIVPSVFFSRCPAFVPRPFEVINDSKGGKLGRLVPQYLPFYGGDCFRAVTRKDKRTAELFFEQWLSHGLRGIVASLSVHFWILNNGLPFASEGLLANIIHCVKDGAVRRGSNVTQDAAEVVRKMRHSRGTIHYAFILTGDFDRFFKRSDRFLIRSFM